MLLFYFHFFFFFFQAEDGIRDYKVTGVQTCALPISLRRRAGLLDELRGRGAAAGRDDPALEALFLRLLHDERDLLEDRKSTRLNSSHLVISYAVFCLKKKKKKDVLSYHYDYRIAADNYDV